MFRSKIKVLAVCGVVVMCFVGKSFALSGEAFQWFIYDQELYAKYWNDPDNLNKYLVLKEDNGIYYHPITNQPYTGMAVNCFECAPFWGTMKDGKVTDVADPYDW